MSTCPVYLVNICFTSTDLRLNSFPRAPPPPLLFLVLFLVFLCTTRILVANNVGVTDIIDRVTDDFTGANDWGRMLAGVVTAVAIYPIHTVATTTVPSPPPPSTPPSHTGFSAAAATATEVAEERLHHGDFLFVPVVHPAHETDRHSAPVKKGLGSKAKWSTTKGGNGEENQNTRVS